MVFRYVRALSHLDRLDLLFWKLERFPKRLVHLGICEHSNRTQVLNKTSDPRPPREGGLGALPNEPWSGLFVVRTQSIQQTVPAPVQVKAAK